jgi:hypothetical protein
MRSIPIVRGALVATLGAVACRSVSTVPTPAHHGQRDDVSRGEILTVLGRSSTAYDLVKVLRPTMLLRRTVIGVEPTATLMPKELPGVHIHIDDVRVGDINVLFTIPAQTVASIQWLSATEASTRYGNGHTAGVISVTTLTGRY